MGCGLREATLCLVSREWTSGQGQLFPALVQEVAAQMGKARGEVEESQLQGSHMENTAFYL